MPLIDIINIIKLMNWHPMLRVLSLEIHEDFYRFLITIPRSFMFDFSHTCALWTKSRGQKEYYFKDLFHRCRANLGLPLLPQKSGFRMSMGSSEALHGDSFSYICLPCICSHGKIFLLRTCH